MPAIMASVTRFEAIKAEAERVVPTGIDPAIQPFGVEIAIADEIFIKQMHVPFKDTLIPQHSHSYEHVSMLAAGRVDVWRDGSYWQAFIAPCAIVIAAGVKHTFRTLEDNTIIYCIHNITRTGEVEIAEEHQLSLEGV